MYNLSNISVVTYNVNGLRDSDKRRSIFNYLKATKSHIILLQETHSSPEIENIWSNEWGRKIIFNHGTNFSRGVALLIVKECPITIDTIRLDSEGRILIIDAQLSEQKFVLANKPQMKINLCFSCIYFNLSLKETTHP